MLRCARYSAINTWKWWRKSGASVSRIPALCYLAFVMDRAPEIRNNKRPSSNDRKRYAIAVGKIGSMCDSFFFFFIVDFIVLRSILTWPRITRVCIYRYTCFLTLSIRFKMLRRIVSRKMLVEIILLLFFFSSLFRKITYSRQCSWWSTLKNLVLSDHGDRIEEYRWNKWKVRVKR